MEYTQWAMFEFHSVLIKRLNPCCNGIYSMRVNITHITPKEVLILVVMEYTQWVLELSQWFLHFVVLILVVMEYTQWVRDDENASFAVKS